MTEVGETDEQKAYYQLVTGLHRIAASHRLTHCPLALVLIMSPPGPFDQCIRDDPPPYYKPYPPPDPPTIAATLATAMSVVAEAKKTTVRMIEANQLAVAKANRSAQRQHIMHANKMKLANEALINQARHRVIAHSDK